MVNVFYGSLTKGSSFSHLNVSKGKTFFFIRQVRVTNESFLDLYLDVTSNTISVNSLNTKMNLLIVDYIIFHLINVCGNGDLNITTEACDDGNIVNGDGCSSKCLIESGFNCTNISNMSVCCPSLCSSCISPTVCLTCYNGSYLLSTSFVCLLSCPITYY